VEVLSRFQADALLTLMEDANMLATKTLQPLH